MNKLLRLTVASALSWGCFGMATNLHATPTNQSDRLPSMSVQKTADENDQTSIEWIEVNVETPGSLGVEILYKVSTLGDVKALRVTGRLNEADATTLTNLKAIEHLDLSEASLNAIPKNAFKLTPLVSVLLPEDLETIGNEAFAQTSLTQIKIPASVNTYGDYCFYGCEQMIEAFLLSSANLSVGIFKNCKSLEQVELSEGITTIGNDAFRYCYALSRIKLPASLETIGAYAFNDTYALIDIVLPSNLKKIFSGAFWGTGLKKVLIPTFTSLDSDVFNHAQSLEEVTLPSTFFTHNYYSLFGYCKSLKSVECPMPIPPRGDHNTFYDVDLSNVTLKVPEFAVVNYKLDSYWMQFGQIEGTASYDYIPIDGQLSLANNRRPNNPSTFNLQPGAELIIGGNTPLNMLGMDITYQTRDYNYYKISNWKFGQIINSCSAVNTNKGSINLTMHANAWYFLSFPCNVALREITHSEGADFVVRQYDGAVRAVEGVGNSWKDLSSDATLQTGKGYIIRTNQDGNLYIPINAQGCVQILDNKDRILTPTAHKSEQPENVGWNLLGNPWTSYYDLSASDITTTIQTYDTYHNTYQAYSLLDDHIVLHPGQAFFIQQPEDGTITLPTDGRCFSAEGIESLMKIRGIEGNSRLLFDLTLSGMNASDRTRIVINPDSKQEYEIGKDAAKLFPEIDEYSAIYSLDNEGNPLAINERPLSDGRVPLIFETSKSGVYTLSATRTNGIITILDLITGNKTGLCEGDSMEIELPGQGEVCSRYMAIIEETQSTGVDSNLDVNENFDVIGGYGILEVEGTTGKIEVFSTDGRLVATSILDRSFALTPGLYIVKSGNMSKKCIVK